MRQEYTDKSVSFAVCSVDPSQKAMLQTGRGSGAQAPRPKNPGFSGWAPGRQRACSCRAAEVCASMSVAGSIRAMHIGTEPSLGAAG